MVEVRYDVNSVVSVSFWKRINKKCLKNNVKEYVKEYDKSSCVLLNVIFQKFFINPFSK